ncbi:MAG: hypothetical protein HOP20_01885 [Sulfuriferula sp.]|nr:hypothetical protein [Sulfuriferula sp.]
MNTQFLSQISAMPTRDAENNVVSWHVFRSLSDAECYADNIRLAHGQYVVGGIDFDSVGSLWWVGVAVDDMARWGNVSAINKHAA